MTEEEKKPHPADELTEEQKLRRIRERFVTDGDTVVWEPNPDDVFNEPPPAPQGPQP